MSGRGFLKAWFPRASNVDEGAPLLSRVFRARGLTDPAATSAFLEPSLRRLHDPSLIPDLDRAAARLIDAAKGGERIVIYGDYDVDGITATAVLFHTIRQIVPDANVDSYVPHRLDEGYGLNADAIREIVAGGAKVIVSVDCGVTAVEPARVARELGVDLIITDHHNPPATLEDLPPAFAVVHPRRPDSTYPFGELCGAGVAFKLAWRMATMASGASRVSDEMRELLVELLGLVSLGVIADVVPLEDENRVIAWAGLRRVRGSRFEGLNALLEASGLSNDKVDAQDVGFKLAPRLNACGRMGHAREAVELLTVATGARAIEIAENLSRLNDDRRATEKAIFEQAQEMARETGMTGVERRAIVLAHDDWHAGVVGIVCSRLVEAFHRPTILLCRREGMLHGSGRSIDGFSLHGALEKCAPMLTKFGGHDMAAGLTLSADRLQEFVDAFTERANELIAPQDLIGRASYDCAAAPDELSPEVVEQLARLAPFGRCNPSVCLRLNHLRVMRVELFGATSRHLSLWVTDARRPTSRHLRLIAWNRAAWVEQIPRGAEIEALVAPKINEWNGVKRTEAEVLDLRLVS
jgi:single-stranded-DNA-specific exonuclease